MLDRGDRAMCDPPMSEVRTDAQGNWFCVRGRYFVRVSLGKRSRCARKLHFATNPREADAQSSRVAALIARFRQAAQYDADLAERLLERACAADEQAFRDLEKIVEGLVGGVERVVKSGANGTPAPALATETFRSVFERWNRGELARDFPDHVREKRSSVEDRHRARKHILSIRLADGGRFGDLPIAEVRLEHCERVMAALPRELSRSSRRHAGQLMHRVLALAVYPLRLIAANPLPRGFLPKQGSTRAKSYLFPDEERALLACTDVPLEHRMLYGFLAREGMRKSEALRLTWEDLNLERGMVRLDVNKTDEPRAWALAPDVAAALQIWRAMRPRSKRVFDLPQPARLALTFRKHLRSANVHRGELFEKSKTRLPIRLHDLRATFVTVHLAHGKSETWIADRTGHKSSQMINTYRRQARTWGELGVDALAPLDTGIPELVAAAVPHATTRAGKSRVA